MMLNIFDFFLSAGKLTSLLLPAAAVGAVGYCYMKLKVIFEVLYIYI
jgi:hypothetical protein